MRIIQDMNENIYAPPMPPYGAPRGGSEPLPGMQRKKPKKKKNKALVILKKLLTIIATTLLSLFLVMIITGTIVCTALTVYVLNFMEDSTSITLQELESGSDTLFYGSELDENGNEKLVVLKRIKTDVQRIPVTIDRIPQHVRDCFVYTEDERFYTHDGVDYKRTFSAFVNMFLHIYDTEQGGSTITQQLIKNVTGDDEHTPQRKIREIFSAMQLEKSYSKDEILAEYLNFISFGGPINGIQLASLSYFGKNVEDLTIPEASVLAAIPKDPNNYGPFTEHTDDFDRPLEGRTINRDRQEYVLYKLYENGAITYDEYQEYLNTPLVYADTEEYKQLHPEASAEELIQEQNDNSWEMDAMYYEVLDFLEEQFNVDQEEAIKRLNKGGYKIYTTLDSQMQDYVAERFLDLNNLMPADSVIRWVDLDGDGEAEEYKPHVAFIAMNYDGTIRAVIGDWGEKSGSIITNYAVQEPRPIGSTIKPISTYGLALENNTIHWGSTFRDEGIMEVNGLPWPSNYTTDGNVSISHATNFVYYFLQRSYNTIPAQLCKELTPHAVFEFCTNNMGLKLDTYDEDYSPLSIGALTYGITLENLVNAYLPYGNEGVYCDAHIVTRIEDSNQQVIYQNNGNARQAVSDETAWVMNRLLKNVVENGTGTGARLQNKVVCGKTGTTENWWDLTFVGLTRDFASGVTIGYKQNNDLLKLPTSLHSADVWKNIIGDYIETNFADTPSDFDPVGTVIENSMCSISGMIAGPSCPKGITGYWKSDNAPVCSGGHYVPPVDTGGDENGDGGDESGNGGDENGNGGEDGDTGGGDVGGGDVGGGDVGGGDVGGGDVGGGDIGGGGDIPAVQEPVPADPNAA